MPDDSRAPRSLSSSRMEAFSDGVFSIAATLLVLDLALDPPGTPLEQVLHAWPAYLGYLVSFLTIGAAWLLHSAMTDRLARADFLLMRINLLLLLVIAFLPFPTKLVAEAIHDTDDERVFVTMYGLTLLTIRLLSFALDAYARREHLYADTQGDEELQTDRHTIDPRLDRLRRRDPRRARPAEAGGRAVLRTRDLSRRPVPRHTTTALHEVMTSCERPRRPDDRSPSRADSRRVMNAKASKGGAALVALATAQFLMVLDQSVMNVSISQLVKDFDTTVT